MIRYCDAARVAAFASDVAQHLPETFEVQTFPQKWEKAAIVLVNGDERIALLHRTFSECHNNKVTFMGLRLEADLSDPACLSFEKGTTTTAALTRSPKAVAAQLGRNVLPYYRNQLASQRRMEAHQAAQRSMRRAEAERIVALLPGSEYTPTNTNRFYDSELISFSGPGGKGRLSVYSDRDGLSYALTFGQDDAFCADLVTLLRKHSG
ncbi:MULTISPECIES: hypothetical protein [unclassified Nonomuraea]|uniref:hypothetical protein n=1 Tax=unclassified Nonomuraea TaxID=2593643 RepID=UPI0033E366C1